MNTQKTTQAVVRLIPSDEGWLEGEAIRQLHTSAALPGVTKAVGLPDLHPGKGAPVGAAFFSRTVLYPHIAGNDVGCGIGFWQTTLKARKIKRDKWARKLTDLHLPWEGDVHNWLPKSDIAVPDSHARLLGTIGSGNHFAELQRVEQVFCPESFATAGLDHKGLFLLVHSGSRGLGEALLRQHTDQRGTAGLPQDSAEAYQYLAAHDYARQWAASNRALIANRFAEALHAKSTAILDICHNSIEKREVDEDTGWLHRKGAAQADKGLLIIPGSRGSLSYLVAPIGDQSRNLWSLAHGAGRKWNRNSCKGRLKTKFSIDSLRQTRLGSVVICEDRDLLYEEAPQAYKNIEAVIGQMKDAGLIKIIATLRPIITYKRRARS